MTFKLGEELERMADLIGKPMPKGDGIIRKSDKSKKVRVTKRTSHNKALTRPHGPCRTNG